MPSGGYVPGSQFSRRIMNSTTPPETSFRYQDPRGEAESYVPEYLKRKPHFTDWLPESVSEPLAGMREKMHAGLGASGIDTDKPSIYQGQSRIGTQDDTEGTLQKLLNKWELPLAGRAGDVVRNEVEEEALGPVYKMASIAGKPLAAAGKSLLGKGAASAAGILPTGGYRPDILRFGDIFNRRLNIDTPELEKVMRLAESAGDSKLVEAYLNRTTHPTAQSEIQKVFDLSELNAPEADITDEMARQMAIFGNSPAPPRRGSFPGLGTPDTPIPAGPGRKTIEDVAGGPVLDYGRFNLGGIIHKRVGEGPGGSRVMEKGGMRSRDDFGTVSGRPMRPRESAQEEAQTRIMELLQGDTPIAHQISGGGTAQRFLPPSYKGWTKVTHSPTYQNTIAQVQTPAIANQLAAEQARDIFGGVTDRHTGQFMFDPAAQHVIGVDKGFGDLGSYGFRGSLMPAEDTLLPHTGVGMYDEIAKGGRLRGLVDPDTYQRMAALGLSIPEPEWRQVLDPLMEAQFITGQRDKDTAMRNFMQSIQDMPAHLDKYYRDYVKP